MTVQFLYYHRPPTVYDKTFFGGNRLVISMAYIIGCLSCGKVLK